MALAGHGRAHRPAARTERAAKVLPLAFYDRLACPKRYVSLNRGGHMPIEEPAIDNLDSALPDLLAELGLAGQPDPGRRALD